MGRFVRFGASSSFFSGGTGIVAAALVGCGSTASDSNVAHDASVDVTAEARAVTPEAASTSHPKMPDATRPEAAPEAAATDAR